MPLADRGGAGLWAAFGPRRFQPAGCDERYRRLGLNDAQCLPLMNFLPVHQAPYKRELKLNSAPAKSRRPFQALSMIRIIMICIYLQKIIVIIRAIFR
ncbi:hypothetical protein C1Y35_28080 [Pseudomonas sp. GW456-L14]|nr:hypothetical protein C1Y35_28080 [Pseudomonas sp. GW456-L14]PMY47378.1 hypothetical protein C1Y34_31475 [Pseudomonas sp. GW456-L12]